MSVVGLYNNTLRRIVQVGVHVHLMTIQVQNNHIKDQTYY